jgi:hypothetical protein
MDIWVGREFWNILDNTNFYLQHPELLLLQNATASRTLDQQSSILQDIIRALKEWEQMRMELSLTNLKLYRIGDRPSESLLPSNIKPSIIWQYESLARSLESQIDREFGASETLASVFRDTVALAATLSHSFILTHQLPQEGADSLLPGICLGLQSCRIPCQVVTLQDRIATIERNYLRQLFVQVGLAKLLWAGLRLTVLHLLVPSTFQTSILHRRSGQDQVSEVNSLTEYANSENTIWQESQGFWYQL